MTHHEDDDTEVAELRAHENWARRRRARLLANPHCADPDHPGCAHCEPEENED